MIVWKGYKEDFSPKLVPHKFYVYAIRKAEDSSVCYVGKGSGYRAKFHKISPGNSAISRVVKNSPNYYIEILNSSNDEDVIFELEKSYIRKFGRITEGGTLLNFSDGGRNTAKSYFNEKGVREKVSLSISKLKGKPLFIDGFIFPSIKYACRKLQYDRNHVKYLLKINRAFFLTDDIYSKHKAYLSYVEDKVAQYRKAVKKSEKKVTTNRAVVVNGIIYSSTTEAAREQGVTQGAITNRIARGNQKNTYYLDEYHGQDLCFDV